MAAGSCCCSLIAARTVGTKILLNYGVQWRFLADFFCEPVGFLGFSPTGRTKEPIPFFLFRSNLPLRTYRPTWPAVIPL